jgi:hypothetical protein
VTDSVDFVAFVTFFASYYFWTGPAFHFFFFQNPFLEFRHLFLGYYGGIFLGADLSLQKPQDTVITSGRGELLQLPLSAFLASLPGIILGLFAKRNPYRTFVLFPLFLSSLHRDKKGLVKKGARRNKQENKKKQKAKDETIRTCLWLYYTFHLQYGVVFSACSQMASVFEKATN